MDGRNLGNTTPSSGREQKSDRKWIKTCKTACARAQKNQRTRQRGGAHPPERHQPPDQDSEHSRRPPRVPQVPYMQRVVVHGGLVGLHTRAQRDRHQKPRGFLSPARPASSPARAAWEGAAKLVDFIVPRRRFLSTPCCAKKMLPPKCMCLTPELSSVVKYPWDLAIAESPQYPRSPREPARGHAPGKKTV